MTNLNKTREEIIYELALSLNKGDTYAPEDRVRIAVAQYADLVNEKIITEWCDHNWMLTGHCHSHEYMCDQYTFKCSKCGKIDIRECPF